MSTNVLARQLSITVTVLLLVQTQSALLNALASSVLLERVYSVLMSTNALCLRQTIAIQNPLVQTRWDHSVAVAALDTSRTLWSRVSHVKM